MKKYWGSGGTKLRILNLGTKWRPLEEKFHPQKGHEQFFLPSFKLPWRILIRLMRVKWRHTEGGENILDPWWEVCDLGQLDLVRGTWTVNGSNPCRGLHLPFHSAVWVTAVERKQWFGKDVSFLHSSGVQTSLRTAINRRVPWGQMPRYQNKVYRILHHVKRPIW